MTVSLSRQPDCLLLEPEICLEIRPGDTWKTIGSHESVVGCDGALPGNCRKDGTKKPFSTMLVVKEAKITSADPRLFEGACKLRVWGKFSNPARSQFPLSFSPVFASALTCLDTWFIRSAAVDTKSG